MFDTPISGTPPKHHSNPIAKPLDFGWSNRRLHGELPRSGPWTRHGSSISQVALALAAVNGEMMNQKASR